MKDFQKMTSSNSKSNKIEYVLGVLIAILTVIIIFVSTVELVAFNKGVYDYHYRKLQIAKNIGMSREDLDKVTDKLLKYTRGKEKDLVVSANIFGEDREVFGEREKLHMVDVKDLYVNTRTTKYISVIILAIIFVIVKNKYLKTKVFKYSAIFIPVIILIMGSIGALFATNFEKYFVMFHEIFFDNDLWMLDPDTEILINIVPEPFFYGIIMLITVIFIVLSIASTVMYFIFYKRSNRV